MATTIKQAFQEYGSNLELTNIQSQLVSSRRANVVTELKKELSLHPEEAKVTGSWARSTMTRYLSEGDVDVMIILHYGNNKDWDCPAGTIKALDRFKLILDRAYPYTTKRRDQNCITMQFSEFRLDIVPAFKNDLGYYTIPDSVRQQWVKTDPFKFAEKITAINKSMGLSFVPLIKMVKGWNRNVGWPIRSFHLECLMIQRYQSYTQGYTYSSMLRFFFEALPQYIFNPCFDPITNDRIDTYLDNAAMKTKREIAIEKADLAFQLAKEAFDDEEKYPSVAIKEWKTILGEFFPSYG